MGTPPDPDFQSSCCGARDSLVHVTHSKRPAEVSISARPRPRPGRISHRYICMYLRHCIRTDGPGLSSSIHTPDIKCRADTDAGTGHDSTTELTSYVYSREPAHSSHIRVSRAHRYDSPPSPYPSGTQQQLQTTIFMCDPDPWSWLAVENSNLHMLRNAL